MEEMTSDIRKGSSVQDHPRKCKLLLSVAAGVEVDKIIKSSYESQGIY